MSVSDSNYASLLAEISWLMLTIRVILHHTGDGTDTGGSTQGCSQVLAGGGNFFPDWESHELFAGGSGVFFGGGGAMLLI